MRRFAAAPPESLATRPAERSAPALERGTLGAWAFEATAAGASALRTLGEAGLSDPSKVAGAVRWKENALRTVWLLPGPRAVLKVFRSRGLTALRALVVGDPARKEWASARALARAGIASAEPLAVGRRRGLAGRRDGFYLAREVEGAETAEARLERRGGGTGEELASLGAFLARVHGAGFAPRDLHAADLLARGGDEAEWLLVDLHAVSRGPLDAHARARGLASLLRSLGRVVPAERRGTIVDAYLGESRIPDPTGFRARLETAGAALERTWRRSRTRRCVEGRGEFVRERDADRIVLRRREVASEAIASAIRAHAGGAGARVLDATSRGRTTTVPGSGPDPWLVKETRAGGLARLLADAVRGSRGRRAWRGARLCELLGIATPRALGLVEERWGPFARRSFLVRAFVGDGSTLRAFVAESLARLAPAERARVARAVGESVGALHRRGLVHRDLSSKNLLVRTVAGTVEVLFIDLEDLRDRGEVGERDRVRALAQLNDLPVSVLRADRLRALRAYERASGATLSRAAIAAVVEGSRARARRREARGA